MRTNIIIENSLMDQALQLSGLNTKKAVVEEALKLYVRTKRQTKLKRLRGALKWEGDLDAMRTV